MSSRLFTPLPDLARLLDRDGRRLFATRMLRLFAYGSLSVVLALYLAALGLDEARIGLLLSLTLLGDTAISLWLTTRADRAGRRRMLLAGAGLMLLAGVVFAITRDFAILLAAATVGVISPSGNEVGPFLSIEQAALAQIVPGRRRTEVFAWYNLAGSFATALGALCGGGLAGALQGAGIDEVTSYRAVIVVYALIGGLLALAFRGLTPSVEAASHTNIPPSPQPHDSVLPSPSGLRPAQRGRGAGSLPLQGGEVNPRPFLGLSESRAVVMRLSALFALDAFAGGFVVQSIVAYWFHIRFGVEPAALGGIFFGANVLAGVSALAAASIARRIGLINTMVFTHLPSNLLLIGVPLMPTLPLAIGLLLVRFSISQMDVPTRQSYTMASVSPAERSAAAGVTGVARTIGAGISPYFTGVLLADPALIGAPFMIAGGIKVVYDLLLWASFRAHKPPEEKE